jgi:hypothetical protein
MLARWRMRSVAVQSLIGARNLSWYKDFNGGQMSESGFKVIVNLLTDWTLAVGNIKKSNKYIFKDSLEVARHF